MIDTIYSKLEKMFDKKLSNKITWWLFMFILWVIAFQFVRAVVGSQAWATAIATGVCLFVYLAARFGCWLFEVDDEPECLREPTHPQPVNWDLLDALDYRPATHAHEWRKRR